MGLADLEDKFNKAIAAIEAKAQEHGLAVTKEITHLRQVAAEWLSPDDNKTDTTQPISGALSEDHPVQQAARRGAKDVAPAKKGGKIQQTRKPVDEDDDD